MFYNASTFNQYISIWDVGQVDDFNSMFNGANAMIEQYSGTTGFGTASNNYTPSQSFFNQWILDLHLFPIIFKELKTTSTYSVVDCWT